MVERGVAVEGGEVERCRGQLGAGGLVVREPAPRYHLRVRSQLQIAALVALETQDLGPQDARVLRLALPLRVPKREGARDVRASHIGLVLMQLVTAPEPLLQ